MIHPIPEYFYTLFNNSISLITVGINATLVDGGSYFGRVEITYDGVTGTVCDDSWSSSDARVLCKSLGYADGEPISNSYYGKGTGPIMMNGLSCYGYESSIFQCRNDGWMTYKDSECSNHTKDASVICYKDGTKVVP